MVMSVDQVTDFDLRGKVDDDQARDPESGMRMWAIIGIDMEEREDGRFRRSSELKVKIASAQRPVVPPSRVPGYNALVAFEGLTLTPYLDVQKCTGPRDGGRHVCRARVAYSLRATGMVEFTGTAE
jgi:hypothetical protein